MNLKKLALIIGYVGAVNLMMTSVKALSSTVLPLSSELKKYPVITSTVITQATVANPVSSTAETLTDKLYNIWIQRSALGNIGNVVKQLNTIKLDNGFMNLYPYSLALLNKYKQNQSEELLIYASLLSPYMSAPYFNISYKIFTAGSGSYSLAVSNLIKAVRTFSYDPYNILRFVSNRLINVTAAFFIVYFVFALFLLFRYSKQIYLHIRGTFSEYIPSYVIIVFSIVIIMLPVLFGFGFLWLIILWLIITLIYQKLTERILSMGFILVIALLTYITLIAAATILKPAEEPFTGIMSIYYGSFSPKDIKGLNTYADNHAGDLYSNLYLGVYYKRIGHYSRAQTYFRRLQDNGYANLPMVICDIGTLEYAMGSNSAADSAYRKAISLDRDFFAAHYNLGQLMLINTSMKGVDELNKAKNINGELFAYYASIYKKSSINRTFVDALPNPMELAYNMFADAFHNETAMEFAGIVISMLIKWPSAERLPYLGLFLLLVFAVIIIFSGYLKKFVRCKLCGRVYDPHTRDDEYKAVLCSDCLQFHIKKNIPDNKKKMAIMRRIDKWEKRLKIINIAVSVLMPGSGYILRGQPIKGMLILFIFSYLLVEYISSFGLITPIFPLNNPYIGVLKLLVLLIITGIYLLNIMFAFKDDTKWH